MKGEKTMKLFEEPKMVLLTLEIEDILTTSIDEGEGGSEDLPII